MPPHADLVLTDEHYTRALGSCRDAAVRRNRTWHLATRPRCALTEIIGKLDDNRFG
jgi:hypothetical protein